MMRPLALATALTACGAEIEVLPPSGHILLHLDTDATVPAPPSAPFDPLAPAPLFDRLLVEVFRPGELAPCSGCTVELDLTDEVLRAGGSLAVQPDAPATGLRARLRMFLAARRASGVIAPEASVETVVHLPDVPEEGRVDAWVMLPTDAVGKPLASLDAPAEAARSDPGPSRVGSWPGARRVGCAESPPDGTVCVPGGAFWMGHPLFLNADRQRLVVVSPFFIDRREATVGDFRASGVGAFDNVGYWSGKSTGGDESDLADWCTYTPTPDPQREALPISCITRDGARAYCQARGGDLPSEAQREYAAGALRFHPYPWGTDAPRCDDAVFARGANLQPLFFDCDGSLPPGDIGGPLALPPEVTPELLAAPRARDAAVLPEGAVFDLGGNLSEWMRDFYQDQSEPCWTKPDTNIFIDPVCDVPSIGGPQHVTRGGSWMSTALPVLAAHRYPREVTTMTASPDVGVRCVYPATASR